MVPEGWSSVELGDLYDFKNGLNTDKANYGHGLKFVNVMDVFKNDRLDEQNIIGRVAVNDKEMSNYSLEYGDVLFNRTSETFDEIAMSAVYLDEKPAIFGGFVIRARPKTNKVSPEFSVYFFQSSVFRSKAVSRGQGAVRANIGQKDLAGICQVVPPVAEQRKIAKILSTWDEAIATKEQLLVKSEQQKTALMQQLLTGKKRLPGFEGEWKQIKLGDLFSERKENGLSGFRLLSVTQDQGVIYRDDVGRKDTSSEDKSKYLKVCSGDIAYNTMRMWQGVSALSEIEGIVSPAYTVLRPGALVDSKFSAYLFKLPATIHLFYRHSQGLVSDTWNLKYNNFAKISVSVPEFEEQKAIASVISSQDQVIAVLKRELVEFRAEKKALMQQLLTGKRRVKVDEKQNDAVPA